MESDQVYPCHNTSTAETDTVNSDSQKYETQREDPLNINATESKEIKTESSLRLECLIHGPLCGEKATNGVSAESREIITESNDGSLQQFECDLQGHLFSKAAANGVHMSNEQEKLPVISISKFLLDGRIVIIFSDACQAVLKLWGSYSNMQNMLKKYGLETHRFHQSKLITLKRIGAIDIQFKQCTYIAEEDFRQLLLKYDESHNTDYAKYIQFLHPVDINRYHSAMNAQHDQSHIGKSQVVLGSVDNPSPGMLTSSLAYKVNTISIEKQNFISLSEMHSLFETHFESPELLTQVLKSLKVAVGKMADSELQRIEFDSDIEGSLRQLYITMKDFERVLQYTSAFLDKNIPNITWVHLGELHVNASCTPIAPKVQNNSLAGLGSCPTSSNASSSFPANKFNDAIMPTSVSVSQSTGVTNNQSRELEQPPNSLREDVLVGSNASQVLPDASHNATTTESSMTLEVANESDTGYIIRTLLVDNEVVVCIPDLHKAVIDMYGQCVQVGNYMHRLSIPKHRFSRVLLKRLKAHNILSSKATLCTYITKTDAARLLEMYNICNQDVDGSDNLHRIVWAEPIILENASNNAKGTSSGRIAQNQATLKIPLFLINDQMVVSLPDVHKVVQLLNGHSVQLHYNLEKLGITKHKYSYSEVNQIKVLGHIKRPSSCTYITKSDAVKLIKFYSTPENQDSLKFIEWQSPIAVERKVSGWAFEGSSSPDVESVYIENNDDNAADGDNGDDNDDVTADYAISDLYKVFVGDELESNNSASEVADQSRALQSTSPLSLSSTPSYSISQPTQPTMTTPDIRNTSQDQLQASISAAMTLSQGSVMHLRNLPDRTVNQVAVGVNHKQVDACGERVSCQTPAQTCCHGSNLISSTQTDLPNPIFTNQIIATSTRSCCGTDECQHCIIASSATATVSSVHSSSVSVGRVRQNASVGSTHFASFVPADQSHQVLKRPNEATASDATWLEQQLKKYKADNEEILKTVQRKETEMKILHDAYQEQIRQEKEHRLTIQRELDEVKSSNTELLQNIQRKELEMKILHDSYKLQMDSEGKKREELETEILNLRGQLAKAPQVKQEPL